MKLLEGNVRRKSNWVFTIVLALTIAFSYFSSQLNFDYDFEKFFPKADNELEYYLEFREKYGYDNEYLLIGLVNEKGIFDSLFLNRVEFLSDTLAKLDDVKRISSLTKAFKTIQTPFGPVKIPYLHIDEPDRYEEDSLNVFQAPELKGGLVSENGKALSIFLQTKDAIKKGESDALLNQIKMLVEEQHFDESHLAGKMVAQTVYVEKLKANFFLFAALSLLLVTSFLYFSFRSLWGILVPVFVVLFAVVWTAGLMQLTGKSLDVMTTLLPTMLFVVGMSDVVHILTKYLEELRSGQDKLPAIRNTMKAVGLPILLTSITTAIGFLTLLFSPIQPIRDFGIYTALGIAIAYILSFTLLPFVLLNIKKPSIVKISVDNLFWEKRLQSLFSWTLHHKKMILLFFSALFLFSFAGIFKIKQNNYLIEDLSEKEPMQQSMRFFENNFSGVRPFEMVIEVKGNSQDVYSAEVLKEIDRIEKYLNEEYQAGFLFSVMNVLKEMNRAEHQGDHAYYQLPEDEFLKQYSKKIKKGKQSKLLQNLIAADGKSCRISGKIHDVGSRVLRERNQKLADFMQHSIVDYRLTGAANLIDQNNAYLSSSMIKALGLSLLVVALIMVILYRSVRMLFIALIPNVIPLLFIGALMGYFGIELKASTAIIFTISFGIATDDTIHFLSRFRAELKKGVEYMEALRKTFIHTGKAVAVTSVILCGGFFTWVFSDFMSTFYFGLLISIVLFVAVLTDLLLLPLLLMSLKKRES